MKYKPTTGDVLIIQEYPATRWTPVYKIKILDVTTQTVMYIRMDSVNSEPKRNLITDFESNYLFIEKLSNDIVTEVKITWYDIFRNLFDCGVFFLYRR